MNHESRIKQLEKELGEVKQLLNSFGLSDKFIPLSQAAKRLDENPWVIKNRIKSDRSVELGKHYKMNGNRYLVKVSEWEKLRAADEKAKHQ